MALAAGVTYYSLLTIFPAIAALVARYGLFSDPSTIARHLDQLGGLLLGGAIDVATSDGRSATLDDTFEVSLTTPKELGGPGGNGANPQNCSPPAMRPISLAT
jgi:membrane protein